MHRFSFQARAARLRVATALLAAAFALVLAGALATPPAHAANCEFVLGFATLHNLIPQKVGACLENEHHAANGDALQMTTGGLLVWRKADNWTAFTDGYRTWVNGPNGLQERLNTQRFAWEANPEGLPVVGSGGTSPTVTRCHTADLALHSGQISAGAGNRFAPLFFSNTSTAPCTLYGFPGLQMLDAQGNALPTNARWGGGQLANQPGPTTVTLQPGASAEFMIHWEVIPVGNETSCPTSAKLEVTPPNAYNFLVIPMSMHACGGGTIDVSAVQPAGIPRVGSVPIDAALAQQTQASVDAGHRPWRLDPVLVVRAYGRTHGFSDSDRLTLVSTSTGAGSGTRQAIVRAVHGDATYQFQLIQPVKIGKGGVWFVNDLHLINASPSD